MTSPLVTLASFLLGAGGLLAMLIPPEPVATPIARAAPLLLLAAGVLSCDLHALLRRELAVSDGALLLTVCCLVPAFAPVDGDVATAATFALLVLAAASIRALRLQGGAAALLLAGLALTSLLGVSQCWHQLDAAEDFALRHGHEIADTVRGRAFLASNRATGTSLVANTFAATLLLALPLLVLALRQRETRWKALLLLPLFVGAFVAAGSAGALLAALLALGLAGWSAAKPWRVFARVGLVGLLLGASFLCTVGLGEQAPEWLRLKQASLAERVDFQSTALRLVGETSLLRGMGWGHYAALAEGVRQPDEAWSSSPHGTWLQVLVEASPGLSLVIASGLILVGLALRRCRQAAIGQERPAAMLVLAAARVPAHAGSSTTRAMLAGGLCAALVAPFLVPMLTPLPLHMNEPVLAAGLLGLVFLVAWRVSTNFVTLRAGCGALALGLLAMGLHGFLDSDLFVPAAAAAFFMAVAAALPTAVDGRTRPWGGAVAALVVGALLVSHVATAEPWRAAQRLAASSNDPALLQERVATARRHALASGDLEAFEDAGPSFAAEGQDGYNALRAASHETLRATPRFELLCLRVLDAAQRAHKISAQDALKCVDELNFPDSPRQSHALNTAARIARAAGDSARAESLETKAREAELRWSATQR